MLEAIGTDKAITSKYGSNGWQAVKIGSQVGWVSGEFSEITSE